MQFKLHINGDFKRAAREIAKNARPAFATVRVEMHDINDPKIVVTQGNYMSISAVLITDMDGNKLTESPHSWLVLPINLFGKVKPQKQGKYRRNAQYELVVTAEKPETEDQPMVGVVEVLDDGVMMKFALQDTGISHKMVAGALRGSLEYQSESVENRMKVLSDWNGLMSISFDVAFLQTMVDLQRGTADSEQVVITFDAWKALRDKQFPVMHVKLPFAKNEHDSNNRNHGLLMPVSLNDSHQDSYNSNIEHGLKLANLVKPVEMN
jgi:hypothetical protein